MGQEKKKVGKGKSKETKSDSKPTIAIGREVEIRSLEDLVLVNISTLQGAFSGKLDNRRATVIFNGSRTITGIMKLGLEAKKLGLSEIGGIEIEKLDRLPIQIESKTDN